MFHILISERGFELIEEVGAAEYQELYLKPIARAMSVFDGERVEFAKVQEPLAT